MAKLTVSKDSPEGQLANAILAALLASDCGHPSALGVLLGLYFAIARQHPCCYESCAANLTEIAADIVALKDSAVNVRSSLHHH